MKRFSVAFCIAISSASCFAAELREERRNPQTANVNAESVGLGAGWKRWPVLRTYEGDCLRKIRMPLGGIGTGTVSLSGRGSLLDWEIESRPAKGSFYGIGKYGTHFAIRCETPDGHKVARLLEGPLLPEEFEGATGCSVPNQGYPRFARAIFRAAYPLAQVELSDPAVPVEVRLEAMNPLVPGDSSASGIPAALLRWRIRNAGSVGLKVSIAAMLVPPVECKAELALEVAPQSGSVTENFEIREPGWNIGLDRYWRRFLGEGTVGPSDPKEPKAIKVIQKCVAVSLEPNEERMIPFVLAWRYPGRKAWGRYSSVKSEDEVGNFYATEYPTAEAAAVRLLNALPELEAKTVAFVRSILAKDAPDVLKEAALFNLSTFRTETCFRTRDGNFFAWEGCYDREGSCLGSCTHVWGYEHALLDLWPDLARSMLDLQFGPALAENGHMAFRIGLPLRPRTKDGQPAAADGQMQCIVKAFEYWRKSGDDAWLVRTWPAIRRALAFCWVVGGWDADCDGVMEGCQHNTMDVEYYGPNPQMEFLYLAALKASAAMAEKTGDEAFAEKCRRLFAKGSVWTEKELFNGEYYEHRIVPPKGFVAEGLRHPTMGAKDLSDPDYQLGSGCLIDQLLGDYAARIVGLGPVADEGNAKKALAAVLRRCRKLPDDDQFNPTRGFAMRGEESLRMAWYPVGRMPRSPFPYYVETMTGFEYVVATLQVLYGDREGAVKTVRDIRNRYDGAKRNPFDEAECGHHYARALSAWSVFKAWNRETPE